MDTDRLIVDGQLCDCERLHSVSVDPPGCLAAGFAKLMSAYANRPAFGWRPAPGKEFEWVSYGRFFTDTCTFGCALRCRLSALNVTTSEATLIGVSGPNSFELLVADFGCLFAGFGTVPLSDAWEPHILGGVSVNCSLAAIITTPKLAKQMMHAAREAKSALLAVMGDVPEGLAAEAAAVCPGLTVCSIASMLAASPPPASSSPPAGGVVHRSPDAIHTILHTSGTTGLPKGVVYTDRLWLANMVTYKGPAAIGFSYQVSCMITDRHGVYTRRCGTAGAPV
jgi:long-subunit acyl-CoA synthetase (AMP-forming)